jgi:hypothetical protein
MAYRPAQLLGMLLLLFLCVLLPLSISLHPPVTINIKAASHHHHGEVV